MVSQEHHKDNTLHLHVAVWLNKKLNFSSEKYWDFVGGKHGNYKLMYRPEGWIKYILKENEYKCTEGFDPKVFVRAKAKKQSPVSVQIADAIVAGEYQIEKLEEFGRGYVMHNLKSIQYYISHIENRVAAKRVNVSLTGIQPDDSFNEYETEIYEWLQRYSERKTLNKGCQGDVHLRLQGPSDIGKTRLLKVLKKHFFRVYDVPHDNDWFDMFNDRDYDLIVFDEFGKGLSMKPQMLNGLVDGMGMKFNRRNREPVIHKRQIPCLLVTNFSWEGCYPKIMEERPDYLKPTRRRFKEVLVPEGAFAPGILTPTLNRLVSHLYKIVGGIEGEDIIIEDIIEEETTNKRVREESD